MKLLWTRYWTMSLRKRYRISQLSAILLTSDGWPLSEEVLGAVTQSGPKVALPRAHVPDKSSFTYKQTPESYNDKLKKWSNCGPPHSMRISHTLSSVSTQRVYNNIIIIFINCNWVVTRWQWLFYMYTKYEIGYY